MCYTETGILYKICLWLIAGGYMSDNLNEKYKEIIEFLYAMSFTLFNELGIEIDIQILKEDKLNAGVKHVKDNKYCICIYSGCLNLDYRIQNITTRYTEDDLQFFWRVKGLRIFECFESDTYRENLNNLFASMILVHIFFHECCHILAKHLEGSEGIHEEYDSTLNGSYELQEREMVADWLSTKLVYESIFRAVVQYDNPDAEEMISILKQITILYWLSLTIEFQIFDSNHLEQTDDFSVLTHPHPAVRLYYNLEAMRESMVDILNTYGLNDDQAEAEVNLIIEEFYIWIQSFLLITDTPIDIRKNDFRIIECYIKLRDIPYKDGVEKNSYVHLIPLPDETRAKLEEYINFCKINE